MGAMLSPRMKWLQVDCLLSGWGKHTALTAASILVLLVAVSGCGGKNTPVNVEGIVTLDGEPLAGATVVFTPIGEHGQSATALTESDGSFRLTNAKGEKGALPGEYKVLVSLGEEMKFAGGEHPDPSEIDKLMTAKMRKQKTSRGKKSPVPAKYANPEITPFKETVPPKGKIKLELSSK
jgi:hypothetical protein